MSELLLHDLTFASGDLTQSDVEHLFMLWVFAMFFPELFPTRPILAMIGPKGSGKTSLLQLVGQLLFGSAFKVSDITDDARDFDAAITNDFLVVADNADRDIKWLADKLAIVATGGTVKRRVYYTTNKMTDFPLKAWVAITSRTPHFRREDVADRLLPLHVKRFKTFGALGKLQADVQQQRNQLLTWVAHMLQKIVAALKQQHGRAPGHRDQADPDYDRSRGRDREEPAGYRCRSGEAPGV